MQHMQGRVSIFPHDWTQPGVRALPERRSAGQQKRVCQGIAYRRESTHLDAYEFERCACHHSLQGIDSFGDG